MKNNKEQEIISFKTIDELIKKPKRLLKVHYEVGNIILFSYKAKHEDNPYDRTPICLILGRNRKYTYGINWNWIPIPMRKGLMNILLSKRNLKNIEKNKPLYMPKKLVKVLFRMGIPAFRKYLNNRITRMGVPIPHKLYPKIINLRAEHFINISSDDAWKIAVNRMKRNKR